MKDVAPTELGIDDNPSYLHFQFDPNAPLTKVIHAEGVFHRLLREVGHEVTDGNQGVEWLVTSAGINGRVSLQVRPVGDLRQVRSDVGASIIHAVIDGVNLLARVADRPDYFNDRALDSLFELTELRQELGGLGFVNGSEAAEVDDDVRTNLESVLSPAYSDYGSVEGTIEAIYLHREKYFNLYDDLTGRRVRCRFARHLPVDQIKEALERRVAAYGTIGYRSDGVAVSADIEQMTVFAKEDDLPTLADMRGILG
jgi:hypothetical protein